MDKRADANQAYSDVPVSTHIHIPMLEDADLNGFAFSLKYGIIVATNRPGEPKDSLTDLRKWSW